MDQRTLHTFLTLADGLHFGRAADACNMSPSTLTRAIKQLEEQLGSILFLRDNRSVSLTREGEVFRDYAREAVSSWSLMQENLQQEGRELTGELSLYSSVTASYSFLFDLLAQLRSEHAGIQITLQTGDPEQAIARVLSGDAQISIGARPQSLPSAVRFKTVSSTPLLFIASRELQGSRRKGSPDAWHQQPLILPERGLARDRALRWFQRRGLVPSISAQVAGNEAIVSMVSLGGGVGVVPGIVLDNSPLAERVQILKVSPKLKPLEVGLFVLKKSLSNRLVSALWNVGA